MFSTKIIKAIIFIFLVEIQYGIVVISVFLLSLLLKVGTTIGDYINKANDTADEKFNDTMNKIPQ